MILSEFYITTKHSSLIYKKFDDKKSTVDVFLNEINLQASVPPVFNVDHILFHFIFRNGLYYVNTSEEKCTAVESLIVSDILSRFYQTVKDLCGTVEEQTILSNTLLVYELVDEIFLFGHSQLITTAKVKPYIQSEPKAYCKPATPITHSHGLFGLERQFQPHDAASKSVMLSKQEQEGRLDKIYVDVIERINTELNSDGSVLKCSVEGQVNIKCLFSSIYQIKVILSNDLEIIDSTSPLGFGKTVYINKCNFDPCVDMSMWPQKILLITPPEGEVTVLSYHVDGEVTNHLPLRVISNISYNNSPVRNVIIRLQLLCEVPNKNEVINIDLAFALPQFVASTSHKLSGSGQTATLSDNVMHWCIPRMMGQTSTTAIFTLTLGDSSPSSFTSLLTTTFEASGFVSSGFRIRSIKPVSRSLPSNTRMAQLEQWIRYVTITESFITKLCF